VFAVIRSTVRLERVGPLSSRVRFLHGTWEMTRPSANADTPAAPNERAMSESEVDENIEDSFPASDPPAWTLGTDHKTTIKPNDESR
jgi:hypothetical protein